MPRWARRTPGRMTRTNRPSQSRMNAACVKPTFIQILPRIQNMNKLNLNTASVYSDNSPPKLMQSLRDLLDADLLFHLQELDTLQRLHQDAGQLILYSNKLHLNLPFCYALSHKVIANPNVFASPMMDQILDQINCLLVVNL
jgi:hypothetical protein